MTRSPGVSGNLDALALPCSYIGLPYPTCPFGFLGQAPVPSFKVHQDNEGCFGGFGVAVEVHLEPQSKGTRRVNAS